jgi:hypothetical protein
LKVNLTERDRDESEQSSRRARGDSRHRVILAQGPKDGVIVNLPSPLVRLTLRRRVSSDPSPAAPARAQPYRSLGPTQGLALRPGTTETSLHAFTHRRASSHQHRQTAPKAPEIGSQKQNAPGHSWHGSLGACSPLPRAREKVWWAMRGRKNILGSLPGIGKHHSSSQVLA